MVDRLLGWKTSPRTNEARERAFRRTPAQIMYEWTSPDPDPPNKGILKHIGVAEKDTPEDRLFGNRQAATGTSSPAPSSRMRISHRSYMSDIGNISVRSMNKLQEEEDEEVAEVQGQRSRRDVARRGARRAAAAAEKNPMPTTMPISRRWRAHPEDWQKSAGVCAPHVSPGLSPF